MCRRRPVVFLALAGLLALPPAGKALAACGCGPDFCKDDPRVPAAFAAKRQSLAGEGYPERLLKLFDKASRCVACAERAPDAFTILRVEPNGDNETGLWSAGDEQAAKAEVQAGILKSYHVFNVRRACSCCGEPEAMDRPDYDRAIDLNRDGALNCAKSGGGVVCN